MAIMLAALAGSSSAQADYNQLDLVSQGNGTSYGQFAHASPDGSRVVFSSLFPLVTSDTDSCTGPPPFGCVDVYERSGGVTTLLSTGPAGGNGDFHVEYRGASTDLTKVFFVSSESLVPGDTDGQQDIYQRSGGVTTLISTGPAGGNSPDYSAYWAGASPDGSRVYFTTDEPLVSGDTDDCGFVPPGCTDVYQRAGGTTTLVSTGPRNANGANYAQYVGAAADGSHVIFSSDAALVTGDHDSNLDLYDRSAGTTTLLSTGPSGGNDAIDAYGWHVSNDGTRVVFTTDESLVSADSDSQTDMYEHSSAGTSLVSTGPAGGNGAYTAGPVQYGSLPMVVASDDGSRIFYITRESLVAADTDDCVDQSSAGEPPGCWDIYQRSGGQTTLVSTAAVGANTRNDATPTAISSDGSRVYFETDGPLSSADIDSCDNSLYGLDPGCTDVYERAGGQTVFISTSPTGDTVNAGAYYSGATPDGSRVFFGTMGAFVPGDTDACPIYFGSDGCPDIYLRAAGATSLVPPDGNGPYPKGFVGVSDDGSRVFFETDEALLSSDSVEFNGSRTPDIYSASLTTGYARAKAATPTYLPLVIAYQGCGSPNRAHAAPLAYASCAPPAPASSNLTVGTHDSNGAAANSTGFMRMTAIPDPNGPGTADLGMTLSFSDARCGSGVSACGASNDASGADYTGQLQARVSSQVTDKRNGAGGTDPATGAAISLDFTAACSATASTAEGALCSASTTLNALSPGAVQAGGRAVWELGEARVYDGGPDGSATTSPNDLFAVQGVFVP